MSNDLDCATLEDQLPEFAAGTLPADELGAVEAHLNTCAGCRADAESLIDVADAVLLFAPSAEPPAGFEARALDRMHPPRRRVPRRRAVFAAAAVALVAIGMVSALLLSLSIGHTDTTSVQEVALRTAGDQTDGTAFLRTGDPGWILIDMTYDEDTSLPVQLVTSDGTVTTAGPLTVRDGHGVLGFTSPVPLADVRELRMVEDDGTVVCHAPIHV